MIIEVPGIKEGVEEIVPKCYDSKSGKRLLLPVTWTETDLWASSPYLFPFRFLGSPS